MATGRPELQMLREIVMSVIVKCFGSANNDGKFLGHEDHGLIFEAFSKKDIAKLKPYRNHPESFFTLRQYRKGEGLGQISSTAGIAKASILIWKRHPATIPHVSTSWLSWEGGRPVKDAIILEA